MDLKLPWQVFTDLIFSYSLGNLKLNVDSFRYCSVALQRTHARKLQMPLCNLCTHFLFSFIST